MIVELLVLILLIGLNAYFAASEIALISLNDNKIRVMAEEGDIKALQLVQLLSEPSRFLATIQIGITLAGFLASAFAAQSFAEPIVLWMSNFDLPISASFLQGFTVVVITIILSYFSLVFGELVPKRVALKKSEAIAFRVIGPLRFISKITSPFVRLLTVSTNLFVRIFGVDPHDNEDDVTEEEIRMLIDVGEERGTIHGHEKEMINNVFEFNNKTVEEIMTHRVEMEALPLETGLAETVAFINRVRYAKIPVFEGNIDNIVGLLYARDLLPLIGAPLPEQFSLQEYLRPPYFIPVMKKTDEAMKSMQQAHVRMAVAVDEYGGTAGLVTLEDLVEEVFGDIYDDHDENPEIRKLGEGRYEVSGKTTLEELEDDLGIRLPEGEYETLNGFVIYQLGQIPPKGQEVEIQHEHIRIRGIEVSEKRIEKFLLEVEKPREEKENSIGKTDPAL